MLHWFVTETVVITYFHKFFWEFKLCRLASESSKERMFHGTKVPRERKFSLWTFRSRERKCRGTKRPGFRMITASKCLSTVRNCETPQAYYATYSVLYAVLLYGVQCIVYSIIRLTQYYYVEISEEHFIVGSERGNADCISTTRFYEPVKATRIWFNVADNGIQMDVILSVVAMFLALRYLFLSIADPDFFSFFSQSRSHKSIKWLISCLQ